MDTDFLQITQPDDWHLHVRDGLAMHDVIADTARQFGRALIMPNLRPPVTTVVQAMDYRARILEAVRLGVISGRIDPDRAGFEPLMTLYLTDQTSAEEIQKAAASGVVLGVKLYPAGATTNSDSGVTDLRRLPYEALAAMERHGLILEVHGEVTQADIDLFDREAVFIETILAPLRRQFPGLRVVFEHITTAEAVAYVQSVSELSAQGAPMLGATLTAHHLLYNRNAIFQGGVRPHWYCLPVLKRERHRLALLAAATSHDARFFLGTDSAPHARHLKEQACGCAGCYTAFHAMPLYAQALDSVGQLSSLECFAAHFGADFYGVPRNQSTIVLKRQPLKIPQSLRFGESELIPLAAGETLEWALG